MGTGREQGFCVCMVALPTHAYVHKYSTVCSGKHYSEAVYVSPGAIAPAAGVVECNKVTIL